MFYSFLEREITIFFEIKCFAFYLNGVYDNKFELDTDIYDVIKNDEKK
jgi:hypothetical protein